LTWKKEKLYGVQGEKEKKGVRASAENVSSGRKRERSSFLNP